MFATSTWVWSCGSPARLVRWRNAAARKPLPGTLSTPPVAATPDCRVALHVVEGALDGGLVCVADLAADLGVGQPEEHADALGRAEGQVEARDAGATALRGERGAGGWIGAGERRLEPVSVDLALRPELARG